MGTDAANNDVEKSLLGKPPANQESKAGLFSRITFRWLNHLIEVGQHAQIQFDDVPLLADSDRCQPVYQQFQDHWSEELRLHNEDPAKHEISLFRALRRSLGSLFWWAAVWKFIHDGAIFVPPLMVGLVINFCKDESVETYWGWVYVGAMALAALTVNLCINRYFHMVFRVGMHVRSTVITCVYRKSLRLSGQARQTMTTGKITTLMSVDSRKLQGSLSYMHTVWSSPLQITIALALLINTIGYSALAGVLVMILLIPVQKVLAKKLGRTRRALMKHTDARVKTTNELLQGIKVVKLYAWERLFSQQVNSIRHDEMVKMKRIFILRAVNSAMWTSGSILVTLATFALYVATDNELDAVKAFSTLALFNILQFPLVAFPNVINSLIEARESLRRLKAFLLADEIDMSAVTVLPKDDSGEAKDPAISIQDGFFHWDVAAANSEQGSTSDAESVAIALVGNDEENPGEALHTLRDINLDIGRGELTVLCGAVGSGKSSLLAAILGEVPSSKATTKVVRRGTVAYVSQESWILNATIRDNILFGLAWDEQRYWTAIRACALEADLEVLSGGDLTEIGEKGINLSGGQKMRVALARAVYADADIYLLDDPLAAVDSHVAKHLFDECICKTLAGKTRLVSTNQLQITAQEAVDNIVFLDAANGTIAEHGAYRGLMDAGKGFQAMASHFFSEHNDSLEKDEAEADVSVDDVDVVQGTKESDVSKAERKVSSVSAKGDVSKPSQGQLQDRGRLIQTETREKGRVGSDVYWRYARATGSLLFIISTLLAFCSSQAARVSVDFWLSVWTGASDKSDRVWFYLGMYGALTLGSVILSFVSSIVLALGNFRASKKLHAQLLEGILRAPMRFFDTTPIGRIVNRFSADTSDIDTKIPESLTSFLRCMFSIIFTLGIISFVTPWFLVSLVFIFLIYLRVSQLYRPASRELKRLDAVSKSPVFAHFSETLGGLSSIRAFGVEQRFAHQSADRINQNNRFFWHQLSLNRWLDTRLQLVALCIVCGATTFLVIGRTSIESGLVGLSLVFAIRITQTLNWMVRMFTELEANMNACERVHEYAQIKSEAAFESVEGSEPPENWPVEGKITLRNASLRYRPELDLVLKDLSLTIAGGSKVGIVGRTGSGKSTLMTALFRIVELADGCIDIDGVDISTIGLHDLRKVLAIIPQDPVLFSGDVRKNLDPFGQHTDEKLWSVLQQVNLADFLAQMYRDSDEEAPAQDSPEVQNGMVPELNLPVEEFGSNFSVGQKQLICMARALLRDATVIMMDEATASLDATTDLMIQHTIRTAFANRTLLVIAHRLNTIIDSDAVLVLDDGRVAEFAHPSTLLDNPEGQFHALVQQTGAASAQNLHQMAREALDKKRQSAPTNTADQ